MGEDETGPHICDANSYRWGGNTGDLKTFTVDVEQEA